LPTETSETPLIKKEVARSSSAPDQLPTEPLPLAEEDKQPELPVNLPFA
jgi:hypothetical protein